VAAQPEIVEVAAGLVFNNGKLLITQRYAGAHLGGLWEFPGGKREACETFEQCLQRELAEELGIQIRVCERLETIQHSYPEKTVLIHFYRCDRMHGEPQALGCPAFRWVEREELRDFEFPEADAALVARLSEDPTLWREQAS